MDSLPLPTARDAGHGARGSGSGCAWEQAQAQAGAELRGSGSGNAGGGRPSAVDTGQGQEGGCEPTTAPGLRSSGQQPAPAGAAEAVAGEASAAYSAAGQAGTPAVAAAADEGEVDVGQLQPGDPDEAGEPYEPMWRRVHGILQDLATHRCWQRQQLLQGQQQLQEQQHDLQEGGAVGAGGVFGGEQELQEMAEHLNASLHIVLQHIQSLLLGPSEVFKYIRGEEGAACMMLLLLLLLLARGWAYGGATGLHTSTAVQPGDGTITTPTPTRAQYRGAPPLPLVSRALCVDYCFGPRPRALRCVCAVAV